MEDAAADTGTLLGLRHLALRCADMARMRAFYEGLLGMRVAWTPDPENVYLTSGADNLALHQTPVSALGTPGGQVLDHFGFILRDVAAVEALHRCMVAAGVPIVHPIKHHRDGSASFYLADPEGNVIQMLYEPHISPLKYR